MLFWRRRDDIGQIISELEKDAKRYRVELRVPNVAEENSSSEEEKGTAKSNSSWKEVRLDLVAIGSPEDLLKFLHMIEHKSYLMTVVDWRIEVQAPILSRGTSALMPNEAVSGEPEEQNVSTNKNSSMRVDVILTTLNNKETIKSQDNKDL
jgi:hypothetical protein